jgi:membrane-associated protease RseP (regulator of RpoE activity)
VYIFHSRVRAPLTALLAVLVYVLIHEGGHAVAGIAAGYTVREVSIFSFTPGVILQGHGSAGQQAFIAASGSAMVILLWLGLMGFQGSRPKGLGAELYSFCTGIELLAWFVSAAVYTIAPAQNDVTKFIRLSGASPLLVAGVTALIAAICGWVFFRPVVGPASLDKNALLEKFQ